MFFRGGTVKRKRTTTRHKIQMHILSKNRKASSNIPQIELRHSPTSVLIVFSWHTSDTTKGIRIKSGDVCGWNQKWDAPFIEDLEPESIRFTKPWRALLKNNQDELGKGLFCLWFIRLHKMPSLFFFHLLSYSSRTISHRIIPLLTSTECAGSWETVLSMCNCINIAYFLGCLFRLIAICTNLSLELRS